MSIVVLHDRLSVMLRGHQYYEEFVVPPANTIPPRTSEKLISVGELDEIAKKSFPVHPIKL
jgi:hypothetical protein